MSRKFEFHSNLTRITGTSHEDRYTFLIFHSGLQKMRNVSDRSCRENQNTHFTLNNFFPPKKSCRLWDNAEKYGKARQATYDNIIRHMSFVCWVTKVTNTPSECTIFIAFPQQQWLCRHSSTLSFYIHYMPCSIRYFGWFAGIWILRACLVVCVNIYHTRPNLCSVLWILWPRISLFISVKSATKYLKHNYMRVRSQKVAGSIPDGVTGIFHWHNPSGRTMALGSTQPLTEMSTGNISWG